MTSAAYATIATELLEENTLLDIVLNRPKGNILTSEVLRELHVVFRRHRDDRRLRLVVIRGAGGHFSFGASVEEHQREHVREMLETFHATVRELAAFPVPVAALVEGRCLGGAFELVLCCHLVFATPTARFGCPEIKLGVLPPVLAAIGSRRLPGAIAERLLLTGAELDAAEAERAGLLTWIMPGEDPQGELLAWYRTNLAPLSAFALREAAYAFRTASGLLGALDLGLAGVEQRYLERVVPSHDGNEGIEAFIARRAPRWEDA